MSARYRDPDYDFEWLTLILMLLVLGIGGFVMAIFFNPSQKDWQGFDAVCFFFLVGWYVDGEFRNIKRKLRNAEGRMEEKLNEISEDLNALREEIATRT